MEYKYLAHLTKNKAYWDAMEKIVDIMKASQDTGKSAMWATYWNTDSGKQTVGQYTIQFTKYPIVYLGRRYFI